MARRWAMGRTGRSAVVLFVGILTVTFVAACGTKKLEIKGKLPVFPVKGKVTMDGQPISGATLYFFPVSKFPPKAAQLQPHAKTEEDGSFQVSTYDSFDGAPAGEYRVTVSWKGSLEGVTFEQQADLSEKVPARYQDPRRSRLKIKVEEAENTIPDWNLAASENQASIAR